MEHTEQQSTCALVQSEWTVVKARHILHERKMHRHCNQKGLESDPGLPVDVLLRLSRLCMCNRAYVSAPCAKLICENTDELSLMYHSWLFAEDGLGDETVDRQETILVNPHRPRPVSLVAGPCCHS